MRPQLKPLPLPPRLQVFCGAMPSAGQPSLTSMGLHGQPALLGQQEAPVQHQPLLQQPPWTDDPVWCQYKANLAMFPAGLSVLELCAGAGTASIAMQLLLAERCPRLVGAWDLDPNLDCIYRHVHGQPPAPVWHLGQHRGDIMKTQLHEFPLANIVVAGPPCPPYSSKGEHLQFEDPRAGPFQRCIDIVADIDHRGQQGTPCLLACSKT